MSKLTDEILIYEYRNNYFVIELSQQGKNRSESPPQRASEIRALSCRLPVKCSPEELGAAARRALDRFDIEPPSFDPWEMACLRRTRKSIFQYRSMAEFEKNCRLVCLSRDPLGGIAGCPTDNHRANPWHGVVPDKTIELARESTNAQIGELIVLLFGMSTTHPDRDCPPEDNPNIKACRLTCP